MIRILSELISVLSELMPFGMGSFAKLMPFGMDSFQSLCLLVGVRFSLAYAFCLAWVKSILKIWHYISCSKFWRFKTCSEADTNFCAFHCFTQDEANFPAAGRRPALACFCRPPAGAASGSVAASPVVEKAPSSCICKLVLYNKTYNIVKYVLLLKPWQICEIREMWKYHV